MTSVILLVMFFAPAANAQISGKERGTDIEIRETAGNINNMLSALMMGAEQDGKADLLKKQDILKAMREEMGEETVLRIELHSEMQKMHLALEYLNGNFGEKSPTSGERLETLKRVEKALGATLDQKEYKILKARTELAHAKGNLSSLRSALQVYYGNTEGTFPDKLDVLTEREKYISVIPSVTPPGHDKSSSVVKYISSVRTMAELARLVDDAGGWLYVNDKGSPLWGSVLINCAHSDPNNPETYVYSY